MNTLFRLSSRRPLVFAIATILAWVLVSLAGVILVALLLQSPINGDLAQSAGALLATVILLLLVSRLGWLHAIGITHFGSWKAWALALVLSVYLLLTSYASFFGETTFDLSALSSPEAQAILIRQAIVGFVEETLFRGVALYILIAAWGRTRFGTLTALLVQAALFGGLHALALLGGSPINLVLPALVYDFVFGLWIGVLAFGAASLWPAIFLHAFSNAVLFIKGLSTPWLAPAWLSYRQQILFELPLVLIGLWIVFKRQRKS